MQKPARTFEEFLQSQNLDDWPRYPYFPEVDPCPLIATLRNEYSLENIAKHLYDNVPLSTEILSKMEERVEECKLKVHEHAKKLVHLECSEGEKDQSPLEQAVETSASDSKDFSVMKKKKKKKKVQFAVDTVQDSRWKRVENYNFPGFQSHHLTNLPRQLEAVQLWDSVVKVQTFKGLNLKILKTLFLSEASIALLQDCFWWWFLQKFKPDQEQQDHLFDRISDSFVALLMSTPNYIKDPFFQVYPDCLSQAIYLTFCEAFPSSHFGDEFKDELMDLIFQWIRGFKPQKCAWKKWNLWCLETPVKCIPKRDSIHLSMFSLFPKERSKSCICCLKFPLHPSAVFINFMAFDQYQSHYVGDGPHFHRSLFNLGGQSPLVLYYLKTHGISNSLQNSRFYKITRTEICEEPTPSSPTYQDVIEESKKFTTDLHNDFLEYNEELGEMKQQRKKVNWKFQRLLSKVSKNPNELRLRTQDLIQKLENQKPGQARPN